MKTKLVKFTIVICLLTNTGMVAAQKENLDDLVPYRKGKLWGLVHHDMAEFYPPVFDSIMLQRIWRNNICVFTGPEQGDRYAQVIYKGKQMHLTPDKKLEKPANPFGENDALEIIEPDELMAARIGLPHAVGDVEWIDSFYTAQDKKRQVKIKRVTDGYQFYVNGNHLTDLDCVNYTRENDSYQLCIDIILKKGQKYGYANLQKGQLILPIVYDDIKVHKGVRSWFIVSKNNQSGVFSRNGTEIVPVRYTYIFNDPSSHEVHHSFLVSDKNGYRFVNRNRDIITESSVNYDELKWLGDAYQLSPYFLAVKKGKSGVVTGEDTVLIPIRYDKINMEDGRFIILVKNKKYGFADARNDFFRTESAYDLFLTRPIRWNFSKNGVEYFLFYVKKNNQRFYVDCFGNEFIAK